MYVHQENLAVERLIRIQEVKCLTGLSVATIYRKIAAKQFPSPVALGTLARAWPLSEVQDWIAERIAERGLDPVRSAGGKANAVDSKALSR
jgi:prophage regulatory protein